MVPVASSVKRPIQANASAAKMLLQALGVHIMCEDKIGSQGDEVWFGRCHYQATLGCTTDTRCGQGVSYDGGGLRWRHKQDTIVMYKCCQCPPSPFISTMSS